MNFEMQKNKNQVLKILTWALPQEAWIADGIVNKKAWTK